MKRGLTLWEAMIGVLVLVVLAAVFFPVRTGGRNFSKTVCLADVKQLGMAMMMYGSDHDERFPSGPWASPGGGWGYGIRPYLKNVDVFHEPEDKTPLPVAAKWPTGAPFPTQVVSFGLNRNLGGADFNRGGIRVFKKPTVLTDLARPEATIAFFEVAQAVGVLSGAPADYEFPTGNASGMPFPKGAYPSGLSPDPAVGHVQYATGDIGGRKLNLGSGAGPRHRQLANYSYADGHARALEAARVSGGEDVVADGCDQGTAPRQPGPCAGQLPAMAAGTTHPAYQGTFSTK